MTMPAGYDQWKTRSDYDDWCCDDDEFEPERDRCYYGHPSYYEEYPFCGRLRCTDCQEVLTAAEVREVDWQNWENTLAIRRARLSMKWWWFKFWLFRPGTPRERLRVWWVRLRARYGPRPHVNDDVPF